MAYYFAVETEENSYVAKNIRNSKRFGREYNSRISYECTLEEIDRFTSEFTDEDTLKQRLLEEEIITELDMNRNIAIIYSKGIENRIVSKTMLYSDSKMMLEFPEQILKYIEEKAKEKDYHFFKTLAEILPEDTISKTLVSKVASLIEKSLTDDKTALEELQQLNILGNNITMEVAKILIYDTKINDGTIRGTNKVNAEKLHNMLAFISDYELSLNKNATHKKVKENTSN